MWDCNEILLWKIVAFEGGVRVMAIYNVFKLKYRRFTLLLYIGDQRKLVF